MQWSVPVDVFDVSLSSVVEEMLYVLHQTVLARLKYHTYWYLYYLHFLKQLKISCFPSLFHQQWNIFEKITDLIRLDYSELRIDTDSSYRCTLLIFHISRPLIFPSLHRSFVPITSVCPQDERRSPLGVDCLLDDGGNPYGKTTMNTLEDVIVYFTQHFRLL